MHYKWRYIVKQTGFHPSRASKCKTRRAPSLQCRRRLVFGCSWARTQSLH